MFLICVEVHLNTEQFRQLMSKGVGSGGSGDFRLRKAGKLCGVTSVSRTLCRFVHTTTEAAFLRSAASLPLFAFLSIWSHAGMTQNRTAHEGSPVRFVDRFRRISSSGHDPACSSSCFLVRRIFFEALKKVFFSPLPREASGKTYNHSAGDIVPDAPPPTAEGQIIDENRKVLRSNEA